MNNVPADGEFPEHIPIPLRTLVVDDSPVLLEGLCAFLKSKPLFHVFGTAANGCEALRMAELHEPDLVLMDLNMPVMDGLEAAAILRHRRPNVRIIIMTLDHPAKAMSAAWAHGAHGFIHKQEITMDLILLAEVRRAFQPKRTKGRWSSL